jgi:hypothetical protein
LEPLLSEYAAELIAMLGCNGSSAEVTASSVVFGAPVLLEEAHGVSVEEVRWSWGATDGWALVARLPRDAELVVKPADEVTSVDLIHALGDHGALVNGGFYDSGPMGLVRHDGTTVHDLTPTGGSGVLFWSPGSPVRIVHRDTWAREGTEALQSIDRLVADGRSMVRTRADARAAARTGVAVTPEAVLLVVAAASSSAAPEGRTRLLRAAEDEGLPLWGFADLLVHLGATEALGHR